MRRPTHSPPQPPHPSPLAVKPQLPVNFEEDTWAKVQDAVNAVHQKRPVGYSLEELYRVRGGSAAPLAMPP